MPTLSDLKPDPKNPRIHNERNIDCSRVVEAAD